MTREEFKNIILDYRAGKMPCNVFTELVTDYLEGKLPFVSWVRFQMHLGVCLSCRSYLTQMKKTIQTLGRLPSGPIPPSVREELLKRFRSFKK